MIKCKIGSNINTNKIENSYAGNYRIKLFVLIYNEQIICVGTYSGRLFCHPASKKGALQIWLF